MSRATNSTGVPGGGDRLWEDTIAERFSPLSATYRSPCFGIFSEDLKTGRSFTVTNGKSQNKAPT